MSISATTLRLLMAAGLSGEALLQVVESIEVDIASAAKAPVAVTEPALTPRQARNARYYARKTQERLNERLNQTSESVLEASYSPPSPEQRKVSPCTPSKETQPSPPSSSLRSDDSLVEGAGATASAADEPLLFGEVLPPAGVVPATARRMGFDATSFGTWWFAYPHKVGKQDALRAFEAVAKRGHVSFEVLMNGLARYVRTKPPDRPWCNPATWLRQGRWDDEPSDDQAGRAGRGGGFQPRQSPGQSIARGFAAALVEHPDSDFGRAARAQGFASADDG
jgi:hypothetical protein